MKTLLGSAAALALLAGPALAGGVERTAFSSRILFEEGSYGEASLGFAAPNVSGVQNGTGASSGDVFDDFVIWSLGFKTDVTDRLSLAVIIDQPIGAQTTYAPSTYALGTGPGSSATLFNAGVTALAKYQLPRNVSVYGGIRALQTSGDVSLITTGGLYTLDTSSELDFGFVAGAAWEKPEIAARVSLTYISPITQTFDATEANNGTPTPVGDQQFSTTIPQSLTLEAQSGIAENTLLFGSVRWVNWSVFDITPDAFALSGNSLVDFDDDTYTFNLGVARRFTEEWAGTASATYEPPTGGFSGNLGPTDGRTAITLGAVYSPNDRVDITGGVTYSWLGDTQTESATPGVFLGDFSGNDAISAGIRFGLKL
ncbi:MAG: outer membrane protein transport protein [Pseudomonadota bacterium]